MADGADGLFVDPEIGSLKLYHKRWDYPNGLEFEIDEIPSRPCTEEDFADPDKFFAVHPAFELDLEVVKSGMICPQEKIVLNGGYDTQSASHLVIAFDKCQPSDSQ